MIHIMQNKKNIIQTVCTLNFFNLTSDFTMFLCSFSIGVSVSSALVTVLSTVGLGSVADSPAISVTHGVTSC